MMRSIDFFYFPSSTYTYLTVNRISALAAESEITVRWRPYNLRAILRETGVVPYPADTAKSRYMWKDLARQAAIRGIAFPPTPPPYPSDPELLNLRMALVAEEQGWVEEYSKRLSVLGSSTIARQEWTGTCVPSFRRSVVTRKR